MRESRKRRLTLFSRLLIHENGVGGGKNVFGFEWKDLRPLKTETPAHTIVLTAAAPSSQCPLLSLRVPR